MKKSADSSWLILGFGAVVRSVMDTIINKS